MSLATTVAATKPAKLKSADKASSMSANLSHAKYIVSKVFGILVLVILGIIVIFPVYYSFAGTLMQQ